MLLSNYRFAIETGRYRRIPRDERWCICCKHQSNAVKEDETHILLHCPVYELCPNFTNLNDGEYLNYLLNSDGPIVKAAARYFYLANLMHSSVNIS